MNRSTPLLIPLFRLLALIAPAMLLGCSGAQGPYPSLAHRPIEDRRIGEAEEAEAPLPVAPIVDSALDRQVALQLAAAEESVGAFEALLAATRSAIANAKGAAPGEERWVVAQQALSRLDQARGSTAVAVAALDQLRIDSANRTPPVDTSRLDAAWTRVVAIQAEQEAALRPLVAALPTG